MQGGGGLTEYKLRLQRPGLDAMSPEIYKRTEIGNVMLWSTAQMHIQSNNNL